MLSLDNKLEIISIVVSTCLTIITLIISIFFGLCTDLENRKNKKIFKIKNYILNILKDFKYLNQNYNENDSNDELKNLFEKNVFIKANKNFEKIVNKFSELPESNLINVFLFSKIQNLDGISNFYDVILNLKNENIKVISDIKHKIKLIYKKIKSINKIIYEKFNLLIYEDWHYSFNYEILKNLIISKSYLNIINLKNQNLVKKSNKLHKNKKKYKEFKNDLKNISKNNLKKIKDTGSFELNLYFSENNLPTIYDIQNKSYIKSINNTRCEFSIIFNKNIIQKIVFNKDNYKDMKLFMNSLKVLKNLFCIENISNLIIFPKDDCTDLKEIKIEIQKLDKGSNNEK